ncbi:hypothetical protein ACFQDH_08675 [Flexivirga alba]|uniref:Uncharacterized protein n=2 Tax=Flexivirga alba TaxID=702742 RepID=A0ABW2AEL7_9MICO
MAVAVTRVDGDVDGTLDGLLASVLLDDAAVAGTFDAVVFETALVLVLHPASGNATRLAALAKTTADFIPHIFMA